MRPIDNDLHAFNFKIQNKSTCCVVVIVAVRFHEISHYCDESAADGFKKVCATSRHNNNNDNNMTEKIKADGFSQLLV